MSGLPIDANPTQSTNKLKNIFEQAIQKKKEEANKTYQPNYQRDIKPPSNTSSQPVQFNLIDNTSSLSTKTNVSGASQQTIQTKTVQPSMSNQNGSNVQTGAISVKDRMKLFEQKKIISTKSDDVQIPLKPTQPPRMNPLQTEVKPIVSFPVTQPPLQVPKVQNTEPIQVLNIPVQERVQPPVKISTPIVTVPHNKQTQSAGSVASSESMSNRMKMWEKKESQKSNFEIDSPIKIPNRMTYQPTVSESNAPQRTTVSGIRLQNNVQTQNTISLPQQIKQTQKPPQIIEPPKSVQNMSVKERIKMMQHTLQNQARQKQQQKNHLTIPSPVQKPMSHQVQFCEPISIPSINTHSTQKPSQPEQPDSLYTVTRVKSKRSRPNFDEI